MYLWSARILSFGVAGIHIGCSILLLLFVFLFASSGNAPQSTRRHSRSVKNIIYKIWFFLLLVVLIKSGLLIKGIKENRPKIIATFLGVMVLVICLSTICFMVDLIVEHLKGQTFESALPELLIVCGIIAIELVILSPVLIFYKNLSKIEDPNDLASNCDGDISCWNELV